MLALKLAQERTSATLLVISLRYRKALTPLAVMLRLEGCSRAEQQVRHCRSSALVLLTRLIRTTCRTCLVSLRLALRLVVLSVMLVSSGQVRKAGALRLVA